MIDLWPQNLGSGSGRVPVAILKEQAAWLEKRTHNIIVGRIDPSYTPRVKVLEKYGSDEDLLMYDFYFQVPLLDNYHFNLLTMFHGIDLYPVIINTDEAIKKELSGDTINFIADNEAELLNLLKRIFNSNRAKTIINSILTQVKEIVPPASL